MKRTDNQVNELLAEVTEKDKADCRKFWDFLSCKDSATPDKPVANAAPKANAAGAALFATKPTTNAAPTTDNRGKGVADMLAKSGHTHEQFVQRMRRSIAINASSSDPADRVKAEKLKIVLAEYLGYVVGNSIAVRHTPRFVCNAADGGCAGGCAADDPKHLCPKCQKALKRKGKKKAPRISAEELAAHIKDNPMMTNTLTVNSAYPPGGFGPFPPGAYDPDGILPPGISTNKKKRDDDGEPDEDADGTEDLYEENARDGHGSEPDDDDDDDYEENEYGSNHGGDGTEEDSEDTLEVPKTVHPPKKVKNKKQRGCGMTTNLNPTPREVHGLHADGVLPLPSTLGQPRLD
jgi:hypothetical protein